MASIESMIKTFTGSDDKAGQARERLELLKNAADAHLKLAEERLALELKGEGGGISNLYIIPGSVARFEKGYTVAVSDKMDEGIKSAIDLFFSGSKDNVKTGFQTLVQSALSALFADTTAGEQSQTFYFITMEHNAFIRVDVFIWKYYFTQKGITDQVQQAFCYTFVKSIINHAKVDDDTMIYFISQQVGDDLSKVEDFIKEMHELRKLIKNDDPHETARAALEKMRAA